MNSFINLLWRFTHYKNRLIIALLALAVFGVSSTLLVSFIGPVFSFLFNMENQASINILKLLPLSIQNVLPIDSPWAILSIRQLILIFPLALGFIALIKGVSGYFQNYLMATMSQMIVRDLRDDLFNHLIHLKKEFYEQNRIGMLVSMTTNDTNMIQDALVKVVGQLLRHLISIVLYLSMLIWIDIKLFAFFLIAMPFVWFLIGRVSQTIEIYVTQVQERLGDIIAYLAEMFRGFLVIVALGGRNREQDKFEIINRGLFHTAKKTILIRTAFAPLMEFIALGTFVIILIYLRFHLNQGRIDVAGMFTFIAISAALFKPIDRIATSIVNIKECSGALKNVFRTLEDNGMLENVGGIESDGPIEKIELVNLHFFRGRIPILQRINMTINRGEKIALVGSSGAGKSTLARLLLYLYPPEERHTFFVNGKPAADYSLAYLRKKIAFISQDVFVFAGSIAENLQYGSVNVSPSEQDQAIKMACAEFVYTMPGGIGYQINEDGSNLSNGQKQRIAIARAILRKAPILILDEATSALDVQTEKVLMRNIFEYARNSNLTLIIVAHRLYTIQNVDRIFVMESGEIIDQGCHEELLRGSLTYQSFLKLATNNA